MVTVMTIDMMVRQHESNDGYIRILIADDIPQVRQELKTILALASKTIHPGIEVVGEAKNGKEAIAQSALLIPDVVLMDLEMPLLDGLAATEIIKKTHPNIGIIALTIHNDVETRQKAAQAGADGFVEKGSQIKELLLAIQRWKRTL